MKAFLLAAGIGTRLRPVTDTTPKCLVEIGGRALIDIWLDALAQVGVDDVVINTHHLAEQVESHLSRRPGRPRVQLRREPVLLGSAGTLRANREFVAGEPMFLAINADNYTNFDLRVLIDAHRRSRPIATLTVFRTPRPSECGILDVDEDGRVVGFVEKPAQPAGDLANAGLYAFHPAVLDEIPDPPPRDIGFDLLPRLVGRARAVRLEGCYFHDIGTTAALAHARNLWKRSAAS